MTGRRPVGKSRLVQELCDRAAKMTVNPLDLADVHAMTGLSAAERPMRC